MSATTRREKRAKRKREIGALRGEAEEQRMTVLRIAPDDQPATRARGARGKSTVGAVRPQKPPKDRRTEGEVQRNICKTLAGLQAVGKILDWYERPRRVATRRERSGIPDLVIAVRPGVVLGLELKRPDGTGVVTETQRRWLDAFGERGLLATHEDEVIRWILGWAR